jgi:hypothetical protein
MKVKELIALLSKQDAEMPVMIQQGEDYQYMRVYSVKEKDLVDADNVVEDGVITAVVIEYS